MASQVMGFFRSFFLLNGSPENSRIINAEFATVLSCTRLAFFLRVSFLLFFDGWRISNLLTGLMFLVVLPSFYRTPY